MDGLRPKIGLNERSWCCKAVRTRPLGPGVQSPFSLNGE